MKAICITMMVAAGVMMAAQAQAADESALAKQKNCFSCHQVDKKVVGPAYREVAARYKTADIPRLVEKIKKGGSGVWGPVPMAPNNVTDDEAKRLVTWILSQK
ncbi:MAG: c-type cytochrome [Zoogloeaceae bacterium]|jgi:cytochrome c|nr:c-type cytochrome [Zoogloeaceae bacterium]